MNDFLEGTAILFSKITNKKNTTNIFNTINKLLILGLIIRLVPAAFTAHPSDIESWRTIGFTLYTGQNPYVIESFGLVYPPLWGFICGIAYATYVATQNFLVFNFTIKLPIILADLGIATYLRKFVFARTGNEKKAKQAMILYLFNPVTIILSGIWGMFDSIPVFLLLLSSLFLFKKHYFRSSFVFGIAIAFKGFYPAMLLPLFLYIIKNEEKIREVLKYLIMSILVPLIVSIPFLVDDTSSFFNMTILHFEQRQLSNLTYWFPIRLVFSQNQNLVSFVAFVSFVILFLIAYFFMLKKVRPKNILLNMSQIVLIFFLTSPTVNEQYFVWLLMPLIIYTTIKDPRMEKFLYILTGIVTVFILSNAGPHLLSPLHFSLGPIQDLWSITPILVVCAILFSVLSLITFQKIIKYKGPIVKEME